MKRFLLGASTAAYQVEGNNIYSDFWAMEQLEHSSFVEKSGDAVDHNNNKQVGIDDIAPCFFWQCEGGIWQTALTLLGYREN